MYSRLHAHTAKENPVSTQTGSYRDAVLHSSPNVIAACKKMVREREIGLNC